MKTQASQSCAGFAGFDLIKNFGGNTVEAMKLTRWIFFLCAFFLFSKAVGAPTPIPGVIFKPTFLTGYDSLTAGTGFILHVENMYVFVTAQHLFGPNGGLEKDLTPEETKEYASALAAMAMDNRCRLLTSTNMLLMPAAKAFSQGDASKDVAGFLLSDYSGASLAVAKQIPTNGDAVYLYARPRGEDSLKIIPGKVVKNSSAGLYYLYDGEKFDFAGTSGAPVLNDAGEVVGINLGGGENKGRQFGFANPVQSFTPLVSAAIKLPAAKDTKHP